MWRDVEPRAPERDRAELAQGSRGGTTPMAVEVVDTGRDPLTRDLDLPRGRSREWVHVAGREYHLTGDDVRTLATVGAFRVVSAGDLGARSTSWPTRPSRAVERLRDDGLVRTMPHVIGKERTTRGDAHRAGTGAAGTTSQAAPDDARQAFYAGVSKPRELAHDTRLYPAYVKAVERLEARGAKVRRVVLEEELKSRYQRFLQDGNRGATRQQRTPDAIAARTWRQWAREHRLPCENGHVQFPDVRLEIEERDGRRDVEDLEVVTPHYRGAHAAAKARSGFTRSGAVGARLGGSRRWPERRTWAVIRTSPRRCCRDRTTSGFRRSCRVRLHRPPGQVPGHRHAALRRLPGSAVLRVRSASSAGQKPHDFLRQPWSRRALRLALSRRRIEAPSSTTCTASASTAPSESPRTATGAR